jgi:formamidopyrimidine-DNA glycosylase
VLEAVREVGLTHLGFKDVGVDYPTLERLHRAMRQTLDHWIERLQVEAGDRFPDKVTAFRPEMAVHGKYDQPCPVCGTKLTKILGMDAAKAMGWKAP